ncbi:MAG: ASKHA domain-containing protein [Robiginitomaculum sp.]
MTTHTLIFTPSGVRADAKDGETVYDVALRNGVDMQSICGGKGLCKRCQIEVEPGKHAKFNIDVLEENIPKLSPTEKKAYHGGELEAHRRLACRAKVHGDLVVEIPSDAREHETSIKKKSTEINTELNSSVMLYMVKLDIPTLDENPCDSIALQTALEGFGVKAVPNHKVLVKIQNILKDHDRTAIAVVRDGSEVIDIWPPSPFNLYGAAIDIGSTSVAIYVYDLTNGGLVYEAAAMNPQIRYGEDLMSRVSYVMMNKGGEKKLTLEIRKQVKSMLADAHKVLELGPNQLLEVTIVGNPIMHHLFIGADPTELGQAPFTLIVKDWLDIPGHLMDLGLSDVARISLLPLIGGHVGADTTGAYLTQLEGMKNKSVLLVDIGTNAEIVLSHNGRVAACSSPTGPAFEGAEISSGVRASIGAIERVRIDPVTKNPKFKIIGHDGWLSESADNISDFNVIGICGSGIFEVMAELAHAGLVDQGGLFIQSAALHRFVAEGKGWKYTLMNRDNNPIYIKQTDVRAVQLAKAALSAGVSLLAKSLNCQHFDEVLLAGAFGTHLDSKYVADIGIIPNTKAEQIRSIGNAAGMGAAMALLSIDEKAKIIEAVKHIEKIETALEPEFQQLFVDAMKFPTATTPSGNTNKRRHRRRAK